MKSKLRDDDELKRFNLQGAFLVRCRVHATNGEKLGYALSLKTELDVKHMKIDSTKAGGNFFYLSDTRKFRSHLWELSGIFLYGDNHGAGISPHQH